MRLSEYLHDDLILPELSAGTKKEVLAELVQAVVRRHPEVDAAVALGVLHDRESLGTTGIGDGVAIPHGKLANISDIVVAVGRSVPGIDFDALDMKPCHLFFLVLAPEQVAGMHLRILAHISRLLKDPQFRRAMLDAPDGEAFKALMRTT
ncbi:PTS sugar transporter subunit IIA [Nitratidesulfovibrio termitidis]|uniref:PTS sugar transporter subunit IIA n=1 Tax=Nitratidesulfovibrio termitidis TaxID=42252 RepID=UPI0003F56C67|nr:PTS sugar transporter subunit IIA [Nitratidesulfovibrio termitidis]